MCWYGGRLAGCSSSRGHTKRYSNGPSVDSQRCSLGGSLASSAAGRDVGGSRSEGLGTSGMEAWCSKPGSSIWNDTAQLRIGWPCWMASISAARDVSVCWSLLASPVGHNMTVGSESERISLYNNVLVDAATGNPPVTIDAAGTPTTDTTLDMINNIVWGWGTGWGTVISNGATANVVGNLYGSPASQPEAQTDALIVCNGNCAGGVTTNARAYVEGNVGDSGVNIDAESTEMIPFPAPVPAASSACQGAYATVAGVGVPGESRWRICRGFR